VKFLRTYKLFESLRGNLRYLGPNPTADTIVTRNNGEKQVLLVKRSKWVSAEPSKWSIPGGFVDTLSKRGEEWKEGYETPLMAAKREVYEETGLDLSSIPNDKFQLIGVYDSL
jgi:ADP-ribose pyrophosphatase YjhB (NUDIX family)